MSVAPRPELFAILGVERQSVDIVGRGAAGDSHDVVAFQIDSFILDLIFQDRVNSTVQNGILTRVEHFHRPHKALVDNFDSFRETLEMTVFKICALVSVTKGASLGASGLVDGRPNTVHFRASAQGFGFLGGVLFLWRRRGRGRSGAGLDLGVFVEVCEHLEPARSFLHWLRSGRLCLGQLEEPLVLGHQLVVVIIIIQIVNVIVIVSRELLLLLLWWWWWWWLLLLHDFVLAVFTLLVGPRPLRPGRGWRGRGRLGLPLAGRDAGAGRGGRGRGREQREARVGGGRGHGGSGGGAGLAAALRSAATAVAVVLVSFVLLLVTLLVLLV